MITEKQEQEFRSMIRSTGYEEAPSKLLGSVIEKLEKDKELAMSKDSTLLPKWVKISFAASFVLALGYFMFNYQSIGLSILSDVSISFSIPDVHFNNIPHFDIGKLSGIALILLFPALLVQFYFIKSFYDNRI